MSERNHRSAFAIADGRACVIGEVAQLADATRVVALELRVRVMPLRRGRCGCAFERCACAA